MEGEGIIPLLHRSWSSCCFRCLIVGAGDVLALDEAGVRSKPSPYPGGLVVGRRDRPVQCGKPEVQQLIINAGTSPPAPSEQRSDRTVRRCRTTRPCDRGVRRLERVAAKSPGPLDAATHRRPPRPSPSGAAASITSFGASGSRWRRLRLLGILLGFARRGILGRLLVGIRVLSPSADFLLGRAPLPQSGCRARMIWR